MPRCPSLNELQEYARLSVSGGADSPVGEHLEGCIKCAKSVAGIVENDPILAALRKAESARQRLDSSLKILRYRVTTTLTSYH